MKFRLAFALAASLVVTAAQAQFTSQSQFPTAPSQMRDLAWMNGTWEGTFAKAGDPTGDSRVTITTTTDGLFQKTVKTSVSNGVTMTETSYTGWDADKGKYVTYTFSNYATSPRIDWSTLDGSNYMANSDPWMVQGQKQQSRTKLTRVNDNEAMFTLERMNADGTWTKVMEGTIKKKM